MDLLLNWNTTEETFVIWNMNWFHSPRGSGYVASCDWSFEFSAWRFEHAVRLCVCWRAPVWTLDQQLISHAGRHQRGLELTLRVEATLHAIRNFTSPSLQQHQTYMPIHIEMNKWSLAMQRIVILRWGEIKLQTSRDAYGSFSSFYFCWVYSGCRWSGNVRCLCFKCGQSATVLFFQRKEGQLYFH